MAAFIHRVR